MTQRDIKRSCQSCDSTVNKWDQFVEDLPDITVIFGTDWHHINWILFNTFVLIY